MPRQIFGEWKPDQPPHLQDGLVTADGVFPIENGYAPLPQFTAANNGDLGSTCLGAAAYRALGDVYIFAGTGSNIYTYSPSGFASIKSGLSSSATIGYRFAIFNNLMLITNGVDPVQKFDPSSPGSTSNLDASVPLLRFMAIVRGFVVGGYADDDPLAVAWSDNGDPTEWTPGTGEAGLQILSTGGDITGVVGGEYGLIFQENRIVRMTYTADDAIWQFDEIATDVGCIAPWSLATYGKITFFLSTKGWMACDGVSVQSIGSEKVDRTFLALVDRSYIDGMSAAVDPLNSLLFVSVPSASPPGLVYIYHFSLQRWTSANLSVERIFPALSSAVSLESLDAIYGNLDDIPVSLDSVLFRGGYPLLMLFDGNGMLGTLSGPPMAATFMGPRLELYQGLRAQVTAVRPLDNAAGGTITLSVANSLSDTVTPTTYSARSSNGMFRTRKAGNLIQYTRNIPAGLPWTYAQGFDIEATPGGRA